MKPNNTHNMIQAKKSVFCHFYMLSMDNYNKTLTNLSSNLYFVTYSVSLIKIPHNYIYLFECECLISINTFVFLFFFSVNAD